MIILAVYYTLADIVLLGQCFYYRGFTLWDEVDTKKSRPGSGYDDYSTENGERHQPTERTALLGNGNGNGHAHTNGGYASQISPGDHQPHHRFPHVDGTHLSPATPFVDPLPSSSSAAGVGTSRPARRLSTLQTVVFNTFAIALVCAAGVLGWYVSSSAARSGKHHKDTKKPNPNALSFDILGQVFGYLCAVLYLGSRLPQLLLNFRRKSTEGVSLLFFLFACIGNLTYVLSIFAYSPVCGGAGQEEQALASKKPRCQPGEAAAIYGRYILVNLSWLLGSLGTLLLDMAIFVQFFLYRKDDDDNGGDIEEEQEEDEGDDEEYERR